MGQQNNGTNSMFLVPRGSLAVAVVAVVAVSIVVVADAVVLLLLHLTAVD